MEMFSKEDVLYLQRRIEFVTALNEYLETREDVFIEFLKTKGLTVEYYRYLSKKLKECYSK